MPRETRELCPELRHRHPLHDKTPGQRLTLVSSIRPANARRGPRAINVSVSLDMPVPGVIAGAGQG